MNLRLITLFAMIPALLFVSSASMAETTPTNALHIESRPQHSFPKVGQYEVLACDFHMHTPYSDGGISPRERVLEAYRQGYDAIAITDHGKTSAYKDAVDLANALGIILIRAFETGISGNEHLVVLNAPEGYTPINAHVWAEKPGQATAFYQDQLEAVAKFGGVVILAHPHVGYREPVLWGIKNGLIQAVEVKNGVVGSGWNTELWNGIYCYPSAFGFALDNKLAMLANTDAHGARTPKSEISYLLVKKRSVDGILEAIRSARTLACFDGMIWGPENLLSDVFKAGLSVTSDYDAVANSTCVRIHNNSPIALKASLQPGTSIDIQPYGEVMAPIDGSSMPANMVLENVWTNLKMNLSISFAAKPVPKKTTGWANF